MDSKNIQTAQAPGPITYGTTGAQVGCLVM